MSHYKVCTKCWHIRCTDCEYHPFTVEKPPDEEDDPDLEACNDCRAFEEMRIISNRCRASHAPCTERTLDQPSPSKPKAEDDD